MPFFFILNALFFLYWALQLRKRMLLSCLVLLIGISFINKFYKFRSIENTKEISDFTVISYNVRLFNVYKWLQRDDVPETILNFINEKNPDILCIQEFSKSTNIDFKTYPFKFIKSEKNDGNSSTAILSKYPIINEGIIEFKKFKTCAIFADIKKGKDIIRVYNIHLESLKITTDVTEIENKNIYNLNQSKSRKMFYSISRGFSKQQIQAEIIKEHKKESPYPIIICIDMNNSAYSYVYRNIKGNLIDSFEESGRGFGTTFKFKFYPVRIDYILVDKNIKVKEFKSFSEFKDSDHYPIMARLSL